MMKTLMKSLPALALGLLTVFSSFETVRAEDSQSQDNIGQIADITTTVGGNVKDCSESLSEFLSTTTDEQALDLVVGALEKAGLDGGWAKQIGGLKKFAGIAGKLLDAITVGDTVRQLSNVWDDRAAFSSVFADQMTGYAADAVSGLVSGLIKTYGTALIAGGTVVAPGIGTIIATGGVWLVSWAGGELAGWAFEKIAGTEVIRDGMENLGGIIWDWFHNGGGDDGSGQKGKPGDEPSPFDSQPESGTGDSSGKKEHFQGLKPFKLLD